MGNNSTDFSEKFTKKNLFNSGDEAYKNVVLEALFNGSYKFNNRTGFATLANFSSFYKVDLSKEYPLLTTKKMMKKSMLSEVFWYLSGEHHIKNLRKDTGIWDAWANEAGDLETAYGYFWRNFPSPKMFLDENGSSLPIASTAEKLIEKGWAKDNGSYFSVDQIQAAVDVIRQSPDSRRIVISAWEPGNALGSILPPCHYTFAFNVDTVDKKLNAHLTQRSGDIALGIPFNLAAYALLTNIVAAQTEFQGSEMVLEPGEFAHTIIDSHIYMGDGETAKYYKNNLDSLVREAGKIKQYSDFELFADDLDKLCRKEGMERNMIIFLSY